MSERRGKPGGFTLLEMLVATAMTAVLAGSLYATLYVSFRAQDTAAEAVEPVRRVELAIERVRADLQSAVVPVGLLAGPLVGEDATDSLNRDNDALQLYCTTPGPRPAGPVGDVILVELCCEPTEDGDGLQLVRRTTVNLLASKVQEPPTEVLCRGVHAFNLRYFDGEQWWDTWDSTEQGDVLPLAVEVTLELEPQDGTSEVQEGYWASHVFPIPCSSLTPGVLPFGAE
jgi:type II secretion system protein J